MGWPFPLARVEQVNDHGCAIACIAIVCGVTYERARATIFPRCKKFRDDESLHLTSAQMMSAIRKLGFSVVKTGDPMKQATPTIFFFSWSAQRPSATTHAVVWDPFKKRVIDPGSDYYSSISLTSYQQRWERFNYTALAVTGKKR